MQQQPEKQEPPKAHFYWFAYYGLVGPSVRYRGKYPMDHLAESGRSTYDFYYPKKNFKSLLKFLELCLEIIFFPKPDSVIVIQKVFSNGFYANSLKILLALSGRPSLYDLDDAEYHRVDPVSIHHFIKNCDYVQVGSLALQQYCRHLNKQVYINTSPVINHDSRKDKRNYKLNIGWVGDFGNGKATSRPFSHKTSLYTEFFPCLNEIGFPVKLTLLGVKMPQDIPEIQAYFAGKPNIELEIPENLEWEDDGWVYDMLSDFDIGLSPMVDHPFTQAKSAFKAKQYLSCGVPVIASNVGENRNFVLHGINGFLAENGAEFKEYLELIARMDDDAYWRMSDACLENLSSFSLEHYSCQLLHIFAFEGIGDLPSIPA
ncbi:MAG: glycosyltransferase [Bacteroidia bacterium]|nr:glycosyltransferase [Bacteroidia bacterium]